MRRVILSFLILITVLFIGCDYENPANKTELLSTHINSDEQSFYYLSKVQIIGDEIYYINASDYALYKTDIHLDAHSKVIGTDLEFFVFAENHLICLNKSGKLIVYDLNFELIAETDLQLGKYYRGYINFEYYQNLIVYDDRIVYVNSEDTLYSFVFQSGKMKQLTDRDVFLIEPYRDSVLCLDATNKKLLKNEYAFFLIDRDGQYEIELFKENHVYDFKINDNYVYYVDGEYTLFRFSMDDLKRQELYWNPGFWNLQVLSNKVVMLTDYIVISNLDGSNYTIISEDSLHLVDVSEKYVIYGFSSGELGIYNIDEGSECFIRINTSNCKVLGDILYTTKGFYSIDGELLYSF